ncbi:MAG: CDP-diacylglycerol--glycerol-3-phosphate 3-phosphatidyltransferase [Clostridia bacterium]
MNLPNKITLARIFLIPLVVVVYLLPAKFDFVGSDIVACALFVLCCCTDFIDGSIARKRNMVTDLGKFLDPIADKVIVVVMLFIFVGDQTLANPWGAIVAGIIMSRELIIGAFRTIAVQKKVVIAADGWGKIKTIFLDVGLSALFLDGILFGNCAFFMYLGKITFYIGAALALYSGINYVFKNKAVLMTAPVTNDVSQTTETPSSSQNKD